MKDPAAADLFKTTIEGKFAVPNLLEENIDNLTESIHGALVDNASELLGKARKKKKPRMTNDLLDLCERRRSLKKRRKEGSLAMRNYSKVNKVIRRKIKLVTELDHRPLSRNGLCYQNRKNKTAFNTLKLLTQQQQRRR